MLGAVRNSTIRRIRRSHGRMILANWLRRASEELHSSIAPNRLVEALLLLWSVSMSSYVPYRAASYAARVWSLSSRLVFSKPVSGPRGSAEGLKDYFLGCCLFYAVHIKLKPRVRDRNIVRPRIVAKT